MVAAAPTAAPTVPPPATNPPVKPGTVRDKVGAPARDTLALCFTGDAVRTGDEALAGDPAALFTGDAVGAGDEALTGEPAVLFTGDAVRTGEEALTGEPAVLFTGDAVGARDEKASPHTGEEGLPLCTGEAAACCGEAPPLCFTG